MTRGRLAVVGAGAASVCSPAVWGNAEEADGASGPWSLPLSRARRRRLSPGETLGGASDTGASPRSWSTRWPEPEAAHDAGFPALATKNTTRVPGADPVANAAGVALAVFPSTGGVDGALAVTLVDHDAWAVRYRCREPVADAH